MVFVAFITLAECRFQEFADNTCFAVLIKKNALLASLDNFYLISLIKGLFFCILKTLVSETRELESNTLAMTRNNL